MTDHRAHFGPHNPNETYIAHDVAEQLVDLGEVQMNYVTAGEASSPALLLIPGQTESWWGYAGGGRCWPSTSRCSPSTCGDRAAAPARRAATPSTTWATISSASSTS